MKKLLDKTRVLTPKERRSLAEEGIYLTNLTRENEEKAMYKVLSMVYTNEDLDSLSTLKEEDELFTEILKKTYQVQESDAKN
jgi:hypothetical protein